MKPKTTPLKIAKETISILLIDDNEIDLFVNQKIFEFNGILNVHCFRNPNDALIHLKETDVIYYLILIDIHLPIMNGFEFIDKFNTLGLNKKQGEIKLLSASVNPLDKDKATERNIKFIEKPLIIKSLFTT